MPDTWCRTEVIIYHHTVSPKCNTEKEERPQGNKTYIIILFTWRLKKHTTQHNILGKNHKDIMKYSDKKFQIMVGEKREEIRHRGFHRCQHCSTSGPMLHPYLLNSLFWKVIKFNWNFDDPFWLDLSYLSFPLLNKLHGPIVRNFEVVFKSNPPLTTSCNQSPNPIGSASKIAEFWSLSSFHFSPTE